jgi:NDP-sugar pyrophosphorylase family protein
MWEFHRQKEGFLTVAFYHRSDVSHSGVALLDDDGRIRRFVEKPKAGEVESHWVNAGIYLAEPQILSALETGSAFDFGKDFFPSLLASGQAIYGYKMTAGENLTWIDTPEDYNAALRQVHQL